MGEVVCDGEHNHQGTNFSIRQTDFLVDNRDGVGICRRYLFQLGTKNSLADPEVCDNRPGILTIFQVLFCGNFTISIELFLILHWKQGFWINRLIVLTCADNPQGCDTDSWVSFPRMTYTELRTTHKCWYNINTPIFQSFPSEVYVMIILSIWYLLLVCHEVDLFLISF